MKENNPLVCDVEIVARATKLRKRPYHRYEKPDRFKKRPGSPAGRIRLNVRVGYRRLLNAGCCQAFTNEMTDAPPLC
jgi:hypothetical protein